MKVVAFYFSSIDAKIAKSKKDALDWVSSDAQKFFRAETTKAGTVVMGRKTYEMYGEPLEHRYNVVLTKKPEKFKTKAKEDVIEFTKESPKKLLERLKKRKSEAIFLVGGQEVYQEFMNQGLIDEVWTTLEPVLFGYGLEPFSLAKDKDLQLELLHLTTLSKDTVLLKYEIVKGK